MLSYWEKKSFTKYDIVVIGSGITGLSTAISLKEKDKSLNIIVLERGLLPTGASTKNAGFACVGSLTEILDDLNHHSKQEVIELIKLRKDGLDILRNRLGDEAIGYFENGSYELLFDSNDYRLLKLNSINEMLFPLFGKTIFKTIKNEFGFSEKVELLIESSVEGEINTGKMMFSLLQKAYSLGIEVKTGFEVEEILEKDTEVEIVNKQFSLKAKKVCVCTNAFASKLFPEIRLKPGRGQVLITKPIENLKLKGVYHFDEGYYYFRVIDNRILFGGGRNVDFDTETTTNFELNNKIQADLEEKLRTVILPQQNFEIEHRWAGIMAFGETKKPIIKQVSKNVFAAVKFGGMGIAIGSKAGEDLSELVL
ncbi:MAG: NAD(P)/FAD-dependent oxidoreductase [Chitinophagales bacterium]